MTQKDKELLLADLSARLPYGLICDRLGMHYPLIEIDIKRELVYLLRDDNYVPYSILRGDIIKPYLRPMFSMTEKEAKEIATLHGLKNILSVKITDEYIDVIIDDGFSSTEKITLWYDEIISSIEIFDYLNAHHFDYRGLIPKGLALEAPKGMYKEEQQ